MNSQLEPEQHCREMLKNGASQEDVFGYLRSAGLSKVTSLPILVRVLGISLDRAKALIHTSATWNDVRARDEKFQASLAPNEDKQ